MCAGENLRAMLPDVCVEGTHDSFKLSVGEFTHLSTQGWLDHWGRRGRGLSYLRCDAKHLVTERMVGRRWT